MPDTVTGATRIRVMPWPKKFSLNSKGRRRHCCSAPAWPRRWLSIQVKGGAAGALNVVKRCKVFTRATSLGGVESLIEHRYSIEGERSPIPRDWLRLSIGIESVDDLIADLEQALE